MLSIDVEDDEERDRPHHLHSSGSSSGKRIVGRKGLFLAACFKWICLTLANEENLSIVSNKEALLDVDVSDDSDEEGERNNLQDTTEQTKLFSRYSKSSNSKSTRNLFPWYALFNTSHSPVDSYSSERKEASPANPTPSYAVTRIRSYMADRLDMPVSNLPLLIHAIALYDAHQLKQTLKAWRAAVAIQRQLNAVCNVVHTKRLFHRWCHRMYQKLALEIRFGRVRERDLHRRLRRSMGWWMAMWKAIRHSRRKRANKSHLLLWVWRGMTVRQQAERAGVCRADLYHRKVTLIMSIQGWFRLMNRNHETIRLSLRSTVYAYLLERVKSDWSNTVAHTHVMTSSRSSSKSMVEGVIEGVTGINGSPFSPITIKQSPRTLNSPVPYPDLDPNPTGTPFRSPSSYSSYMPIPQLATYLQQQWLHYLHLPGNEQRRTTHLNPMVLFQYNLSSRRSQVLMERVFATRYHNVRSMVYSLRLWIICTLKNKTMRKRQAAEVQSDDQQIYPYYSFFHMCKAFRTWSHKAHTSARTRRSAQQLTDRTRLNQQERVLGLWLIVTAKREHIRRASNRVICNGFRRVTWHAWFAWCNQLERSKLIKANEIELVAQRSRDIHAFVTAHATAHAQRSQLEVMRIWSMVTRDKKRGRGLIQLYNKTTGLHVLFDAFSKWRTFVSVDVIVTCIKRRCVFDYIPYISVSNIHILTLFWLIPHTTSFMSFIRPKFTLSSHFCLKSSFPPSRWLGYKTRTKHSAIVAYLEVSDRSNHTLVHTCNLSITQ